MCKVWATQTCWVNPFLNKWHCIFFSLLAFVRLSISLQFSFLSLFCKQHMAVFSFSFKLANSHLENSLCKFSGMTDILFWPFHVLYAYLFYSVVFWFFLTLLVWSDWCMFPSPLLTVYFHSMSAPVIYLDIHNRPHSLLYMKTIYQLFLLWDLHSPSTTNPMHEAFRMDPPPLSVPISLGKMFPSAPPNP